MTQAPPPAKTVGTTKSLGTALAGLVTRGGRPSASRPSGSPALVLPESNAEVAFGGPDGGSSADLSGTVSLGQLRARATAEGEPFGDGVPEVAWDPATRFEGVPPRRPRPASAPVAVEPSPPAEAAHAPAQAAWLAESTSLPLAALAGAALRLSGRGR